MPLRFHAIEDDIQNFALVTHAVPAERVRPHIPRQFELETFRDNSREMAFISTSCFCNHDCHWGALRYPAFDFDQTTFRTYATYRGRRGAYFFETWVSTKVSFVGQWSVAAHTRLADFGVDVTGGPNGYPSYSFAARAGDMHVGFSLEATEPVEPKAPFATGDEHGEYITHRLWGFTRNPSGVHVFGRVQHKRMTPWGGRLISGDFGRWTDLGILFPDEYDDVYSVLVQPEVHFTLYLPRPAL